MYDKENGEIRQGQFPTKDQLIEGMELDISPDTIYRICSGYKVDTNKTKKDSSFFKNKHTKG